MSAETKTPAVIEEGAMARVTKDGPDLLGRHRRVGELFRVDEFVRVSDNPDPQPDDIDVDFYEGTDDTGCSITIAAADVELAMTYEQVRARRHPNLTEIRNALAGELMFEGDGWETDATSYDGDRSVEVYGRTDEGLPFAFTVKVTNVWETDL